MKRMLILATLSCAAAFSQAHAQMQTHDGAMSGRNADDLRARCEEMTGNHRLDCLEQLQHRQTRGSLTPEDRAARDEARMEGRTAYTDRMQECDRFTGNLRMDCMQRLQTDRSAAVAPRTTADIRAEARAAYATPADRCDFITTNRRLDCLQQYGRRG